jgi:hypothetical protein
MQNARHRAYRKPALPLAKYKKGVYMPALFRVAVAIRCFLVLACAHFCAATGRSLAVVRTGEGLQDAIRSYARHIIIVEHLDLTEVPPFAPGTITSQAVGVILLGTDSMRVCRFYLDLH